MAFQHFKHSLLSFCGRWCVRKQAINCSVMSEVFIVLHWFLPESREIWAIPGIPVESNLAQGPAKLIKPFWWNLQWNLYAAEMVPGIAQKEWHLEQGRTESCLLMTPRSSIGICQCWFGIIKSPQHSFSTAAIDHNDYPHHHATIITNGHHHTQHTSTVHNDHNIQYFTVPHLSLQESSHSTGIRMESSTPLLKYSFI